jgi:hypothetical protein
MARPKLKRATVGSKYVAIAALTEVLSTAYAFAEDDARRTAEHVVAAAYDVEHFPVAGKVQITLDLSALDKAAELPGGGQ